MLGKLSLLITALMLVLCLVSCSTLGGCYFPEDKASALANGLPYWEDIIVFFPEYIGEWDMDRFAVPRKQLKYLPPTRIFYDTERNIIEWEDRLAPKEFAGYSVEINYYQDYYKGTAEIPFTVVLHFSRPITKGLRDEVAGHEEGERKRLNGFDLNKADPEKCVKAVAFYNNILCLEFILHPSNPRLYYDTSQRFLDKVKTSRFIYFIEDFCP